MEVNVPSRKRLSPDPLGGQVPAPSGVTATVAEWEPGRMRITLAGQDPKPGYLVVSENWYKDWHATVDGKPAPVHRADYTLLSVALPPGAQEVRFEFRSPAYQRGRAISLASVAGVLALLLIPAVRRRRQTDG